MLRTILTLLVIFGDQVCAFTSTPAVVGKMPRVRQVHRVPQYQMQQDRRGFIAQSLAVGALGGALGLRPKVAAALTPDEINQIHLYDNTIPSVCYITTDYNVTTQQQSDPKAGFSRPHGVGTGFIYDNKGHIVTNFHVVNRCVNATVKFIDANGITKEYIPKLTGYDQDKDIAVLKIDTSPVLKPIPLSTNADIKIGMNCFALGNPFGKAFSFTMGVVSGKGRDMNSPSGRKIDNIIQADVPINKGNSGGPLIDSSGRLIGVNTAIFGGDVSTGISLSVSVDDVKKTVDNILKKGIIDHPTLGIEYLTVLPTRAEAFSSGLTYVESGVVILKVIEGSAAQKAGLKGLFRKDNRAVLGDVVVEVDGKPVTNPDEMLKILDDRQPMDKIKFKILRGNELNQTYVDVILGSSEDNYIGLVREQF